MSKSEPFYRTIEELEKIMLEIVPEIPAAVRNACHNLGHHPQAAEVEDFVQQIILLLIDDNYRRLALFDHRASAKTWLQVVCRHHMARLLKKQPVLENLEDLSGELTDPQPDPAKLLISLEREELLQKALSELADHERDLFSLLCQGLSAAEIAQIKGITSATVHKRKHNLINRLRRLIKQKE